MKIDLYRKILTAIRDRLPSLTAAGNFKVAISEDIIGLAKSIDISSVQPRNLVQISGTLLTGRDWSLDFANLQNIDVLLSTRASETTLAGIKSKTDLLTFDASNRLAIQNPPNLDVALTTLAKLQRWGRDVTPAWVHGAEVTAPAAGTELVSRTVSTGKVGYIYGFYISAGEANNFKINWITGGATRSILIIFGGKGSLHYAGFIPLNEGLPADAGTTISITNVNTGGSGVIYQARLLIGEM